MEIYCDSCILIYFFDHAGPLNIRVATELSRRAKAGDSLATSDLVRLECRVRPMRLGETAKLAAFDAFFARPDVRRIPITSEVFDKATAIRAAHGFKLGDALHLAAAIQAGCDRFLTNDARLAACKEIPVDVLP